jgi:hypothetical protein
MKLETFPKFKTLGKLRKKLESPGTIPKISAYHFRIKPFCFEDFLFA